MNIKKNYLTFQIGVLVKNKRVLNVRPFTFQPYMLYNLYMLGKSFLGPKGQLKVIAGKESGSKSNNG